MHVEQVTAITMTAARPTIWFADRRATETRTARATASHASTLLPEPLSITLLTKT